MAPESQKKVSFKSLLLWLMLPVAIAGCNLEKEIDIALPEGDSQLVVECYLTPGYPILLLLSETRGYFESPSVPLVSGATVVITHNDVRDTLYNITIVDTVLTGKVFNYVSLNLIPEDYTSPFFLEITDRKGRVAYAQTQPVLPVSIDTIRLESTGDTSASVSVEWSDNRATDNYYRVTIHDSSLFDNPRRDAFLSDKNYTSEKMRVFARSGYSINDTLIVSLYHLDKAHYDFLSSAVDASNSNGNPFAVPGKVVTNVEGGGTGIFTFLSFDRDTIYGRDW